MKKLIDACFRLAYKLAFPVVVRLYALLRVRLRGVFVLIWHDGELLVVKNSYKRRHSVPGGLMKRAEAPLVCAVRETREEVGVHLDLDQLALVGELGDGYGGCAFVAEAYLDHRPAIRIDQREIVWAGFLPLDQAMQLSFHGELGNWLKTHRMGTAAD